MSNQETYLGDVQDVSGTTVSISLSAESLTGFVYIDGQGYRIGQIGSFIRIPIGFINLFGIISQVGASAVPQSQIENQNRLILIGSLMIGIFILLILVASSSEIKPLFTSWFTFSFRDEGVSFAFLA